MPIACCEVSSRQLTHNFVRFSGIKECLFKGKSMSCGCSGAWRSPDNCLRSLTRPWVLEPLMRTLISSAWTSSPFSFLRTTLILPLCPYTCSPPFRILTDPSLLVQIIVFTLEYMDFVYAIFVPWPHALNAASSWALHGNCSEEVYLRCKQDIWHRVFWHWMAFYWLHLHPNMSVARA